MHVPQLNFGKIASGGRKRSFILKPAHSLLPTLHQLGNNLKAHQFNNNLIADNLVSFFKIITLSLSPLKISAQNEKENPHTIKVHSLAEINKKMFLLLDEFNYHIPL